MNVEECANNYIPNDENVQGEMGLVGNQNEGQPQAQREEFWLWKMIKSQTADGSINSFNDHPLNKDSNTNVSQIIRGATGMLGQLNFAIVDILLGLMGFIKDKNNINDATFVPEEKDIFEKEHPKYPNGRPTVVNGQPNV